MRFVFFETPLFTRLLPACLEDDEYRALQWALMQRPERGDLIRRTGGDEAKNLTAQQCRLLRNAIHDELAARRDDA